MKNTLFLSPGFIVAFLLISMGFTGFLISSGNWILTGDTETTTVDCNTCFQLTDTLPSQVGCVWDHDPFSIADGIRLDFRMNFGSIDGNGADGMCMVLSGVPDQCRGVGGFIGAQNLSNALVLEFDTWTDVNNPGDFASLDDHVAFYFGNNQFDPLFGPVNVGVDSALNIEDGLFHDISFRWDAESFVFEVIFDGRSVLNGDIDMMSFFPDDEVYLGFTGSTGGARNTQIVCPPDTTLAGTIEPPVLSVTDTSVCRQATGVLFYAEASNADIEWSINGDATFEDLGDSIIVDFNDTDVEICAQAIDCDTISLPVCFSVDLSPPVQFSLPDSVQICEDETITLDPIINSGVAPYSYTWSTGEVSSSIEVSPSSPQSYSVTITDDCGNTSSQSIYIGITESFNVEISLDDPCLSGSMCREVSLVFSGNRPYVLNFFNDGVPSSLLVNSSDTTLEFCEEGQYLFTGISVGECTGDISGDNLLILDPEEVTSILSYDFDDCEASPGETANYDEFNSTASCVLPCSDMLASTIFRSPSHIYRHSCTPGQEGAAICVGSLDTCDYIVGSEASIVWEIELDPEANTFITLDSLRFYERAPQEYDWINGASGPNNYPTRYGLRILVNNTEVFQENDLSTETDWNLESFSFDDITVGNDATVRFELLPYCLIGNGEAVSAWDIDELDIFMHCSNDPTGGIAGTIRHLNGTPDADVSVNLNHYGVNLEQAITDEEGSFSFTDLPFDTDYLITPISEGKFLQPGVSTLDLVLIQKHLLGLQEFESPYQYIAADVSENETISALDLILMRKQLLGINQDLDAWKYILDYNELTIENPFDGEEEAWVDLILDAKFPDLDFTSVKMGDVSGEINAIDDQIEQRSSRTIDIEALWDGTHKLSLNSTQRITIAGLQLSLPIQLRDDFRIHSEYFDLSASDYHYDGSQLVIAIALHEAVEITVHADLLSIDGIIGSDAGHHPATLSNELYRQEQDGSLEVLAMNIKEQGEQKSSNETEIRIAPNPFEQDFTILLTDLEEGEVEMHLYDAQGKKVAFHTSAVERGNNIIHWSPDVSAAGLYILQVIHENQPYKSIKIIRSKY